jgi:hypothetical protein
VLAGHAFKEAAKLKKPKRRTRATMRPGKPDTARLSIARIEERQRVQTRKRRAEIDPKTKRPKR